MKQYALPKDLSSGVDLTGLNQQLRGKEVQLNWSAVETAPDRALATLLEGLRIDADADVLGLGSVPDNLADTIQRSLERSARRQPPAAARAPTPGDTTGRDPEIWSAPAEDVSPPELHGEVVGPLQPLPRSGEPRTARILAVPPAHAIRAEFEHLVLGDLLGPAGGPEEEIDERTVRDRYLVGMLAPKRRPADESEDDELAVAGPDSTEEGTVDPPANGPTTMLPSSFGLTFCVSGETPGLRVTVRWGHYRRVEREGAEEDESDRPRRVWKRHPVEAVLVFRPIGDGTIARREAHPDYPDVSVQGRVRRRGDDWIVSLFLVNEQEEPKLNRDSSWLFQPELVVEAEDGAAVFCRRPLTRNLPTGDPSSLDEERAMAMLYRKRVEFAVGHGVAVHAETPEGVFDQALRLSTRVVPSYEVAQTTAPAPSEIEGLSEVVLDMQTLGAITSDQIGPALRPLVRAYADWIVRERERVEAGVDGLAEHRSTAQDTLARCESALHRIEAGIALVETSPQAAEAFRFMNRAMALQRVRTLYTERVRRGQAADLNEIDVPKNRSWYPFQLAFILLNLPALSDLHHPERRTEPSAVADLLWFPTGGGKTEAYLGITAYTLAMRRLQGDVAGRSGQHGVAVLMRYTLRLLTLQTLQQFQRASALLCACEVLRRGAEEDGDERWGREPFRIGLWVGQRMTPNWTDQSQYAISQEHGNYHQGSTLGGSGSPAQLPHCPWCGEKIDPGHDIKVEDYGKGQGRTITYCGDRLGTCPFSARQAPGEGLPVVVVDEEIYRRLPAVLIATVDKFAQMPWAGPTQALFGQVSGYCERHGFRSPDLKDADSHHATSSLPRARTVQTSLLRPPDLIIQDELHLISGPLGSLVGAYETAVDELCSWEVYGRKIRPKVVASTATIRRAADQVHSLFLRRVEVFPPHGLDVEDNFFARQREPSEEYPGRRYLGVCAQGRRLKAVLIRVYVAHLAAAQLLYEKYGKAADPWMTLVGYFNAMRELGGMRRLVDDDVRQRLGRTDQRGLAKRRPPNVEELTSRKASIDIPLILDQLEVTFDPDVQADRQARQKRGEKVRTPMPIDVLLATNMVSVGVDVRRLGLMVVAGQPKSSAEYIQATSRVGRSHPGLVCTVLNWARPRDLSHYERFEHYHATFYQQVEALSVTPFSPRTIDRALSALLVSLIRLRGTDLNANHAAGQIARSHPYVQAAVAAITERAWRVTLQTERRDLVRDALEERLDEWLHEAGRVTGGRRLGYKDEVDGVTSGLLQRPSLDAWGLFTVLGSLRDVEPTIDLILDDRGMDDPPSTRSNNPSATGT